jgi:ATP-binding cassette subfamily C (CFTR/MRP) protein 4
VLCGLSFTLPAGSSCGIAGRTGSGKSTLALVLFRLLPLDSGAIYLDGVDISSLGLKRLRQQLTLIPQDPLLFSGTLRSNLDPQGQHPDADLWRVLERVQLKGVVTAGGGLEAGVVEGGSNLSVGQRQLLCMAR